MRKALVFCWLPVWFQLSSNKIPPAEFQHDSTSSAPARFRQDSSRFQAGFHHDFISVPSRASILQRFFEQNMYDFSSRICTIFRAKSVRIFEQNLYEFSSRIGTIFRANLYEQSTINGTNLAAELSTMTHNYIDELLDMKTLDSPEKIKTRAFSWTSRAPDSQLQQINYLFFYFKMYKWV